MFLWAPGRVPASALLAPPGLRRDDGRHRRRGRGPRARAATLAQTRGQLSGFSTILILTMSALGGSMFPRFLMSEACRRSDC